MTRLFSMPKPAGTVTIKLGGLPITVITTAEHDALLARRVVLTNQQITIANEAARTPREIRPLVTAEQLIADALIRLLDEAVSNDGVALIERAKRGDVLTDEEQSRVKSLLRLQHERIVGLLIELSA